MHVLAPDIAGPPVLASSPLAAIFVLLIVVPILEALIYWLFRWPGLLNALHAAWLVNLVTSLIGVVLMQVFFRPPFTASFFVLAWAATTVIEGALLVWRSHTPRRVWPAVVTANLLSYLLLWLLSRA